MSHSPDDIQEYPGADIKERHGSINKWLYPVYASLVGWAIYYLITYLP